MKWIEIKQQHPDSFILLGDIVEEKISDNKFKLLEGTVLQISQDPKEIRKRYQECRRKGQNVLYTLPSTPEDFVIEDVPFMGIAR